MFKGKIVITLLISLGTSAAFADFRSLVAKNSNAYHVIKGKPARDPIFLGGAAFGAAAGSFMSRCTFDAAVLSGDYLGGIIDNIHAFKDGRASTWGKRLFRVGCAGVCATGATMWGSAMLLSAGFAATSFSLGGAGLVMYAAERKEVK